MPHQLLDRLESALTEIDKPSAQNADEYPAESIRLLQDAGIPSGPFRSSLGGFDASLEESVLAITRLAAHSPDLALVLSMPLGLAAAFGTPEHLVPEANRAQWHAQVEEVAEDYRAGRLYAACNSEKGAGGSLASIKTTATRAGDSFAVTGEKILASGGTFAHTFFSTAKVEPTDLPGAGVVEFFLVDVASPGVTVLNDWNGFGMRATESQSVRYDAAPARAVLGFPNFIEIVRPIEYWFCLFAAIPLGCARAVLETLGTPAPTSPATRLRLSEALMRYESLQAYLLETARGWRYGAGPAERARVLRTKTYVSEQSVRLCAELFALGGGRHYRRNDPAAMALASAFAGTALRPPLALGLDTMLEQFDLEAALGNQPPD